MKIPAALIFALLSLVFGGFILRDFIRGGQCLSPSARVWLRVALIFGVMAVLLMWLVSNPIN